jgi:hypothetical protein
MSYEIVKGIKINKDDGKVFLKSSSNNVSPKHYNWWECESLSKILQEQDSIKVEKEILEMYWSGTFQPGTDNLYSRSIRFYKNQLPYTWDNVGGPADIGTEKYGKVIKYSRDELQDALHEKFLEFKKRNRSNRYCLKHENGHYFRKILGRYIYFATEKERAKQFNSYEDAFLYAARTNQDPQKAIVKIN